MALELKFCGLRKGPDFKNERRTGKKHIKRSNFVFFATWPRQSTYTWCSLYPDPVAPQTSVVVFKGIANLPLVASELSNPRSLTSFLCKRCFLSCRLKVKVAEDFRIRYWRPYLWANKFKGTFSWNADQFHTNNEFFKLVLNQAILMQAFFDTV